jgi:carbamoyl-phosphate synthase large subunit
LQEGLQEVHIHRLRTDKGVIPTYKLVDTCAAEFDAVTPYFYSCYEDENEATHDPLAKKILVIGSGPIRIGQGVEFDYCSVHCVWALREAGIKAIIVNNNPETVSTDFDTSDRLYFEPLVFEDVLNIIDEEKPDGVIVQFGGQTAINLAQPLNNVGVRIIGTSNDSIDRAEDRDRFDTLVEERGIPRPPGKSVFTVADAIRAAETIGYPVLLRPSYVWAGAPWRSSTTRPSCSITWHRRQGQREHPVLVDKYLLGTEIEVDAVCDGQQVLIPGIMQHIERAGFIRRQHGGFSGILPAPGNHWQSRGVYHPTGPGLESQRLDQYSICGIPGGTVCAGSQPPFQPDGAFYQQGDRDSPGQTGHRNHVGQKPAVFGLSERLAAGAGLFRRQGTGLFLQ